jgi:hypothetical protein
MKTTIKNKPLEFSEALKKALEKCLPDIDLNINEVCDCTVDEVIRGEIDQYQLPEGILNERVNKLLKRISLHVYGSNIDVRVSELRNLIFKGDGICDHCGSNDVTDMGHKYECNTCNHIHYWRDFE